MQRTCSAVWASITLLTARTPACLFTSVYWEAYRAMQWDHSFTFTNIWSLLIWTCVCFTCRKPSWSRGIMRGFYTFRVSSRNCRPRTSGETSAIYTLFTAVKQLYNWLFCLPGFTIIFKVPTPFPHSNSSTFQALFKHFQAFPPAVAKYICGLLV